MEGTGTEEDNGKDAIGGDIDIEELEANVARSVGLVLFSPPRIDSDERDRVLFW